MRGSADRTSVDCVQLIVAQQALIRFHFVIHGFAPVGDEIHRRSKEACAQFVQAAVMAITQKGVRQGKITMGSHGQSSQPAAAESRNALSVGAGRQYSA